MKRIIIAFFTLLPFILLSQTDGTVNKGSGIFYFSGKPVFDPSGFADYGEFAIDVNAKKAYVYSGSGTVWNQLMTVDTITTLADTTTLDRQVGKLAFVTSIGQYYNVDKDSNFQPLGGVYVKPDGTPIVAGDTLPTVNDIIIAVDSIQQIPSLNVNLGDRIKVKSTGAEYLVQADSVAGYNVDTVAVVPTNAGYAHLQKNKGSINVKWFNATGDGSSDDTEPFNNAIKYVKTFEGGQVYVPSDSSFYSIENVHVLTGVKIFGDGYGQSPQTADRGNTHVDVINGGNGFIIGEIDFSPIIKNRGAVVENLYITNNDNTAKTAIRIGSLNSYVNVSEFVIQNLRIDGFTNDTLKHLVYDNSTPELGQNESAITGAFDHYGASGIFIATGVRGTYQNIKITNCKYGIVES